MGTSEERLVRAQERADDARERLANDLDALKNWVMPNRLFGRIARDAKEGGAQALSAGTEAVKARPGLVAGALALGALFLARKPIARAFSRRKADKNPETPRPPARSTANAKAKSTAKTTAAKPAATRTTTKRAPAKRATATRTRKAKP